MAEKVLISVSDELQDHYRSIKEYLQQLIDDNAEEKTVVSAMNAVTSILDKLSKIQQELYNSDSMAQFQQIVISAIARADKKVHETILEELEEIFGRDF